MTWSVDGVAGGNATYGFVSPAGLYSTPAVMLDPSINPVTVAVSVAAGGQTASADARVTVTTTARTITSINPWLFYVENPKGALVGNIAVNGYNFGQSDAWDLEPDALGSPNDSLQFVSSNQATVVLDFGLANNPSPGFGTLQDCDENKANCSNSEPFAFWRDQNLMAVGENLFFFVDYDTTTNSYNLDGSAASSIYINGLTDMPVLGSSIAVDNGTTFVLVGSTLGNVVWVGLNPPNCFFNGSPSPSFRVILPRRENSRHVNELQASPTVTYGC
jgi:hypothetical protein